MTRKRRASSKPSVLVAPAASTMYTTPQALVSPLSPLRNRILSVATTPAKSSRSTSTGTHTKFADPSVLSPPLKKRVHTRSEARAVKIQPFEDEDYDDAAAAAAATEERVDSEHDGSHRHNIKPDPHLPDPYRHKAKVFHHNGSVYDAMLTRV